MIRLLCVFLLSIPLLVLQDAMAQSYRYMDEAGNIFFVDRLQDVPFRYRNQIPGLSPTPDPALRGKKGKNKVAKPKPTKKPRVKPTKKPRIKPTKVPRGSKHKSKPQEVERVVKEEEIITEKPSAAPPVPQAARPGPSGSAATEAQLAPSAEDVSEPIQ